MWLDPENILSTSEFAPPLSLKTAQAQLGLIYYRLDANPLKRSCLNSLADALNQPEVQVVDGLMRPAGVVDENQPGGIGLPHLNTSTRSDAG